MSRPERTPVAADLFTYCTREKIDTWHVVRNHNAQGIVERVICKSCGSEHRYKVPVQSESKRSLTSSTSIVRRSSASLSSSAPKAKSSSSSNVLSETWFSKIKAWGEREVKKYNPTVSLDAGEVVEHISFGKGCVEKLRDNKADILFKDGLKTLPCKKKSSSLLSID
jgi:hypothetical protein